MDGFWTLVEAQLTELRKASDADDVLRVLGRERNPYGDPAMGVGDGFFAGDGDECMGALLAAGWTILWAEASYHWAMKAPRGESAVTYVEGDVYRGNVR